MSSLPLESDEPDRGEAVQISPAAPVLLRLPQRPWGATATLPASVVDSIAGHQPPKVGVVREAFLPHDAQPRPLASAVVPLGAGRAAVASAISAPAARLLVDEYERTAGGDYRLSNGSTDLLRLLHREGVRVCHVPDVALALNGSYNSTVGMLAAKAARQSTNEVLMVAPTAFGFNEQTAADNTFMHSSGKTGSKSNVAGKTETVTQTVLREFAGLHHVLAEQAGVRVNLFQHAESHGTPDAVFPNNWFTTHAAGEASGSVKENTLMLYPMKAPNRAAERRQDIIDVLRTKGYTRVLDLSGEEAGGRGRFLEGTGVLVLDRINGTAYVSLSDRADRGLAERWVAELGYRDLVTFHSTDDLGAAVYHTNVMMAVGSDVAVVCAEAVPDAKERRHLLASLRRHHEVVEISRRQMDALCGNVIELEDGRGHPVLALSSQSYHAFTDDQRRQLQRHLAALHHAPIDTLEFIGGGGVRCSLGEVF
jgi:hypothetical protein